MKNKHKLKSTLQKNNDDDILLLLEDSRITSKQIELYNVSKKEFVNTENPIYIIEHNYEMLLKHNIYLEDMMKKISDNSSLTEEQIKNCLDNSYIRYLRYMLNL